MKTALTELHLHLDGSLNIHWAYQKVIEKGILEPSATFEDFYHILFKNNGHHSETSIRKFDILCDILQDYDSLFEATYNLVKTLDELGLIYAEIRFAPQHHTKKGLSQLETCQAVIDGANKAMQECLIKVGIINCLMHKGDSAQFNDQENRETVEATRQLLNKGIVGIDLAGFENNCDFSQYKYLFDLAHQYNIPATCHAGEMGVAEHMYDAFDFKVDRIGHGVNCVNNPDILKKVIDSQIPLEVCVTSNVKHNMDYSAHPIRQLLEKGAKVTINTDNMIFSLSDTIHEHNMLKQLGVSEETLLQCTYNAIDVAFCNEQTKQYLRNRVKEINGIS